MKVAISTARQAHYRLPANAFVRLGHQVTMYTSTPPSRLKGFDPAVRNKFVPAPVTLVNGLTRITMPVWLNDLDCAIYDRLAAALVKDCQLLVGASTSCLDTGKAVQRQGGTYVVDRACPDIRVQQAMMVEEAKKVGGVFRTNAAWFIERQVEEYEQADLILSPSRYSSSTFPAHLQKKICLAPLFGRARVAERRKKPAGSPFVVGVVGGQPLRKGYLYLLQAWQQLALPNAQLKIRTSADFSPYPLLTKLVADQPNVSLISYVPDISDFYAECDAFILPSIDDGFGMALFEALANGVPSIATHNCGASELLVNGRNAILIDAFSVDQIKDSIQTLYESLELRARYEQAGPGAVANLQSGESAALYDAGIDRLLARAQGLRETTPQIV